MPHNLKDSDNLSNHRRTTRKNPEATPLFVDFFKEFDSTEEIYVYVTSIWFLLKNTKTMVPSPDGDNDFFDIVAGGLHSRHIYSYSA